MTNLADYNNPETKGRQLLAFIGILNDITDIIWTARNYNKSEERFYYSIFLKLQFLLDAVHVQVFNLNNKPHYGLAAALTLRTCMLDVLNLYFVMDEHGDADLTLHRINLIMSDHLKYTYSGLKADEKKRVREDWPNLFDEQFNLIDFGRIGTKELMKGITKYTTTKREAEEALHIYQLFSKYEHNGAFTFDLLHNPYAPNGNRIEKYMIYQAIGICAIACKLISAHWLNPQDSLTGQLDSAITELLKIDVVKS